MLCAKCNNATQYPDGRLRCRDGSILDRPECLAFLPGKAKMYNPEEAKRLLLEEQRKAKPVRKVTLKASPKSEALFDALGSAQSKKSKKIKKPKAKVSKDQMKFEL